MGGKIGCASTDEEGARVAIPRPADTTKKCENSARTPAKSTERRGKRSRRLTLFAVAVVVPVRDLVVEPDGHVLELLALLLLVLWRAELNVAEDLLELSALGATDVAFA